MKLNPKNILFGDDEEKKGPVLLAVTPPRAGERTLLGVENMLGSIAIPEPFSLELAADMDGVTLMARCLDDEVVRGQLSAHYPQARIQKVDEEDDPLRLGCIDRGHSLHMFWDMVDTIIGMTSLQGGGHAMEGDVRYVSEERVRGAGAG